MKKKRIFLISLAAVLLAAAVYALHYFNFLPNRKYSNEDFGIVPYVSGVDKDGDGVDDQTDILRSVRAYLDTKPRYKSQYYATGYPDDEFGVCTDVVAFGLLGAGYDLMALVDEDVRAHREQYAIEDVDRNIDFRRVENLMIYFKNTAIALTTDIRDIEQWQGGDIVIFKNHIGIVSDKRNSRGTPFVLHNSNPVQRYYEEDILARRDDLVAHYRIS